MDVSQLKSAASINETLHLSRKMSQNLPRCDFTLTFLNENTQYTQPLTGWHGKFVTHVENLDFELRKDNVSTENKFWSLRIKT